MYRVDFIDQIWPQVFELGLVDAVLCSLKHLYVGHPTSPQVVPMYLPRKLHNQSGIWVGNESIDDLEKLEYIGEQKKNKAHQLLLISVSTL